MKDSQERTLVSEAGRGPAFCTPPLTIETYLSGIVISNILIYLTCVIMRQNIGTFPSSAAAPFCSTFIIT